MSLVGVADGLLRAIARYCGETAVKTRRKEFNPFYAIVVVVGTTFVLTAGAYWMEALSASGQLGANRPSQSVHEPGAGGERQSDGGSILDRWGTWILIIEVAILGVAAVLAMCLDRLRSWRTTRRDGSEESFEA